MGGSTLSGTLSTELTFDTGTPHLSSCMVSTPILKVFPYTLPVRIMHSGGASAEFLPEDAVGEGVSKISAKKIREGAPIRSWSLSSQFLAGLLKPADGPECRLAGVLCLTSVKVGISIAPL